MKPYVFLHAAPLHHNLYNYGAYIRNRLRGVTSYSLFLLACTLKIKKN